MNFLCGDLNILGGEGNGGLNILGGEGAAEHFGWGGEWGS